MTTTATRLINLIQLLQRQPNQKAAALADELGVSVRTLHRYFGMLEEIGIPIYTERGPYGGFSLVQGYKLPPLVFTPQEAVAVGLGAGLVEEMWGQLYRDAARSALVKVENVLPGAQREEIAWASRSLFAVGMNRTDLSLLAPTLDLLRRALRERRRVRIDYQSRGQAQPSGREVAPYALALRWGWWYLIGYCYLRQGVRAFRVDRIAAVELRDERYTLPDELDLRRYLHDELSAAPQLRVELCFTPQGAQIALDNRLSWESLQVQEDGSALAVFSAPSLEWAASTVLSYGPLVEVLHPPELRALVQVWAQAIAAHYSNETHRE